MATQKAKPTDVTGRAREALAEQFAEDQAQRAGEMSLATAKASAQLDEVIDATTPNRQTVIVDAVTTVGNDEGDMVEIRTTDNIENMTLGKGNTYNFKAGQKYKVTRHVATHLKEKGYLAGVI
jgi:Ni,Fe-hydrogenase maturation factor